MFLRQVAPRNQFAGYQRDSVLVNGRVVVRRGEDKGVLTQLTLLRVLQLISLEGVIQFRLDLVDPTLLVVEIVRERVDTLRF